MLRQVREGPLFMGREHASVHFAISVWIVVGPLENMQDFLDV